MNRDGHAKIQEALGAIAHVRRPASDENVRFVGIRLREYDYSYAPGTHASGEPGIYRDRVTPEDTMNRLGRAGLLESDKTSLASTDPQLRYVDTYTMHEEQSNQAHLVVIVEDLSAPL